MPLNKLSPAALAEMLTAHQRWLQSDGQEGQRADFSDADLQGASLHRIDLQGANLQGATLREANLQEANLIGATGLLPEAIGGANVSGARLPEHMVRFEGLATIKEMSHMASKLFITMLLACAYVWLTLAVTRDAELLTNSTSSHLPIIGTEIPIVGFYWTAPLCLLMLFVYFHLFLQRLWEELAELPAVFPDGKPLDKKVYPWLLNDLVRAHLKFLKARPPPMFYVQKWLSIVLAWWMMPLTMAALWIRYLPRHDWAGTSFHITLVVGATVIGVVFHGLAAMTLSTENTTGVPGDTGRRNARYPILALVVGIAISMVSLGAIRGVDGGFQRSDVRTWVPAGFALVGYSPFADFRGADVSTRPGIWSGKNGEEMALVKGAGLSGKDLRYANAARAFFVNADLSHADLRAIILHAADLRGANLEFARLQAADLEVADLQGANLYGAGMEGASLNGADLRRAMLSHADLEGASLYRVNLEGADLQAANLHAASLEGAKLDGADLRSPIGLTQAQLDQACTNEKTLLPEGLRRSERTCAPPTP